MAGLTRADIAWIAAHIAHQARGISATGLLKNCSTHPKGANCNFMGTQLTEYAVPQGVRASKTALIMPEKMHPDDWVQLGHFLRSSEDSLGLWQADWLKYGYSNYEHEFVDGVVGQMEFRLHGVEKLELLQEVLPEHRHDNLTQEHYLVVSKRCDNDKDRQVWLNTASIEGLSPRELQASIRAHEVIRIDMDKRTVSLPSPYAVQREFRAWRRELGEAWKKWDDQDREDIRETLREIVEFYAELE
jgi:hypothetical protein